MFTSISRRYDLLNSILSAGRHHAWRRAAVARLELRPGDLVLDLCGGTGDLSLEAARAGARVVCCDFSEGMLVRAERKFGRQDRRPAGSGAGDRNAGETAEPRQRRPRTLQADALRLPFADGRFDAVTIGFGIRNLRTLEEGFAEMLRVLRPGGTACILEFSRPTSGLFARFYNFYLNRLLPAVGDAESRRDGPYRYLARTIGEFPAADRLAGMMREQGFTDVAWVHLTGGVVAVHTGRSRLA
jgi:demethylmenaquinone methyltransferase/2-methoxy-6-polyprenyl-1,4-benzoquinol methylase